MLKFSILETGRLERYLNIDLKTIKSTKMMEPITHGQGVLYVPVQLCKAVLKSPGSQKTWFSNMLGEVSYIPVATQM